MLKSLKGSVRKRDSANTAVCLGWTDEIGIVTGSAELTADIDTAIEKINIIYRQTVQFTNSKPCFQEDYNIIVIDAA
jgi:hypothetical protein